MQTDGVGKMCEVLHDGRWWLGELHGDWYRHEGRWRVVVRWSTGPGQTFVQARYEDTVRPAAGRPEAPHPA